MFSFLSYGFGCIFWGALSALIICALLLLLAYKNSRNGNLTPLALIAGVVLFCILSYQFSGIVFGVRCKGSVMDTIDTIALTVNLTDPHNDSRLLKELADQYPVVSSFFDSSLLRQINMEAPLESLRNLIGGYFDDFILNRALWATGATIVFGILMFIPDKTRRKRGRVRRSTSSTSRHYGEDFY